MKSYSSISGTSGGEWLPSNAGSYRPNIGEVAAPSPAPAPTPTVAAPRGRRGLFAGIISSALVAGAGGALAGGVTTALTLQGRLPTLAIFSTQPQLTGTPTVSTVAGAPLVSTTTLGVSLDLPTLYRQVAPAVVAIQTSSRGGSGGQGSGFMADERGHVITNNHVVQGATRLTVHLLDGTSVPATVVKTDPANDLAVLRADIPAAKRAAVRLGDSDAVQPGETAIAVGSPFGFEHSITSGIVSAVDRAFGGSRRTGPIPGLIQTDTAINPGNSGGPLFNASGAVIGINSMGASPVNGSVGVGFAIPVNAAKRLLAQLPG